MILRQQAVLAGVAVAALVSCAPAAAPVSSAGAAPAANAIALRNPGFELPPRPGERCAQHWDCTMHADPSSFRYQLETAAPAAGERSLCIERVKNEPWALATQGVQNDALRGKRLRFSIAIRADRIDGKGVGPWVMIQDAPPGQRHFERLVPRTDGWQRVAVEFTLAPSATMMEVGVALEGGGRVCIDEARLEILAPG